MNTLNVREAILESFHQVLQQTKSELKVDKISDDMILLESGLDSLGFAILVVTLEDKLNYDPFIMMDNPVYPKTFGEFVQIYEENHP